MFLDQFEEMESICIQCHDGPDADTIGAGFALYDYFEKKGKRVSLIYSGMHKITKPSLQIMVNELEIPLVYVSEAPECELLLTVDCQYRGGNVTVFPAEKIGVVDHHPRCIPEPDFCYIRSDYGSCCTVVWELLKEKGYDANANIHVATALYYGLYSDTGQFSEIYSVQDKTMRDELKIDREVMDEMVTSNLSRRELCIAGEALRDHFYNGEYRYALVSTEPCDPNLLGVICDLVNQVATIDACVVYNETATGYKLSVRCAKQVGASRLADALTKDIGTGGGHANKAGGMIMKKLIQSHYGKMDIADILNRRMQDYMREHMR